MVIHRGLALVMPGAAFLGACSGSSKTSSSSGAVAPQAMAKSTEGDFYAEEWYKGRTYVLGTEKEDERFKASNELPNMAMTFVGAGVSGETLILEADAKNPVLQERLKAEYNKRLGSKLS